MSDKNNHLKWCKEKAIKCVNSGDIPKAYKVFIKDMREHPKTFDFLAIQMAGVFAFPVDSIPTSEMKDWINCFDFKTTVKCELKEETK